MGKDDWLVIEPMQGKYLYDSSLTLIPSEITSTLWDLGNLPDAVTQEIHDKYGSLTDKDSCKDYKLILQSLIVGRKKTSGTDIYFGWIIYCPYCNYYHQMFNYFNRPPAVWIAWTILFIALGVVKVAMPTCFTAVVRACNA